MPRLRRIRKPFVRQLLDPVPGLEFYPLQHKYRLNGEWLPYNVSTVLSFDMSPTQRAAIERTKDGPDGWAERGKTIHRVLCEEFLLGEGSIYDEKWAPWIEPLLNEPLFKGVETLATEYAVCDKIKRIGGSFDFLLRVHDDNRVILGDLKTVSSKKGVSSRRPATAQLQAYRSFLATHHPSLVVTDLVTVVCGPERTRIINSDPEGWQEWEDAWGRFNATIPDF